MTFWQFVSLWVSVGIIVTGIYKYKFNIKALDSDQVSSRSFHFGMIAMIIVWPLALMAVLFKKGRRK